MQTKIHKANCDRRRASENTENGQGEAFFSLARTLQRGQQIGQYVFSRTRIIIIITNMLCPGVRLPQSSSVARLQDAMLPHRGTASSLQRCRSSLGRCYFLGSIQLPSVAVVIRHACANDWRSWDAGRKTAFYIFASANFHLDLKTCKTVLLFRFCSYSV